MKPRPTSTLETGKLLDTQQGFVDTFNWMKRVCENIKGDGLTINVDRSDEDAPVIELADNVLDNLGGGGQADCDLTPTLSEGTKIATWTKDGVDTDIYAPSGGYCDCDLSAIQEDGTKIAEWTKDGQTTEIFAPTVEVSALLSQGTKIATVEVDGQVTDLYAPAGGGECTCSMSAIASEYDKDAEGHTQQYWANAEVGRFTDCLGNITKLFAPNHIQVKGNAYPYFSNMGNVFEFTTASDSNIRITTDGTKIIFACYYV